MDKVFVIQVARHVWREGCKHLVDLQGKIQGENSSLSWQEGWGSVGMEGIAGWQGVGRNLYLFLGKPLTLCHQHFFDAANKRAW